MKALAINSAVTRLSISCKNDDHIVSAIYDIGMKQSETLLSAIEYVMEKANVKVEELNYSALSEGPGSFTGLRLAFSALKAIELSNNVPIYGISSLKSYSFEFENFSFPILTVIDAKKDKFYANIIHNNEIILKDGDYDISFLIDKINHFDNLILCGPDAQAFYDNNKSNINNKNVFLPKINSISTESLFLIAESMIENNVSPLKDFDGPVYLRASEAEIKKNE